MKKHRIGAVGALLDEYKRAIAELQQVIADIPEHQLKSIIDATTQDENCRSIQTILSHVVRSGYIYATYIQNRKIGSVENFPQRIYHFNVDGYIQDLDKVFEFTENVFQNIVDSELEEPEESKKMKVSWNQTYDIEQLMEHAIVHILRHRRQIERFKGLSGR